MKLNTIIMCWQHSKY